jgi:Zn-dependent protease
MKVMDRSEIKLLTITTIVLGFCFSFRDWGINSFNFGMGIRNFIFVSILVAISIIIHEIVHKKIAKRYDAIVEFKTWNSLLFTALLITILTNGYVIFAAVWVVVISSKYLFRPGHKSPHLGPWERAKIAASGPFTNFILALISALLYVKTGAFIWNKLMIINFWMAGMNLFPFFRLFAILLMGSKQLAHNITYKLGRAVWGKEKLPYMEGEVIYFGSRLLAVFLLSLVVITAGIIIYFNRVFTALTIGFIGSIIIFLLMHQLFEPKTVIPAH